MKKITSSLTRRSFIGASSAFMIGGCRLAPSCARTAWQDGHYQIHYIYTGRSECMFHIFPDGTSMLLDCGDTMRFYGTRAAVPIPDMSVRAGEFAARYIARANPKGSHVDLLHLSHYHSDHAGCYQYHGGLLPDGRPLAGLSDAARFLTFDRAIDRAWPGFDDPIDALNRGDTTPRHVKALYTHLARTQGTVIEKFALGRRDQFRQVSQNPHPGFSCFNLCADGRYVRKDGSVRDLYAPHVAAIRAGKRKGGLNENGLSCGMIFSYGKFRYFTAGDFSDGRWADPNAFQIENELAEAVGPVDVAKMNHHAHHSMYARLVQALQARVWTNCSLDQQHCTDDSMMRLADRSLYPGDRLLVPTYQPHNRPATNYGTDYLKDVAPAVYETACHVIVDVQPGGDAYSIRCLDAMDPANPVRAEYEFASRG